MVFPPLLKVPGVHPDVWDASVVTTLCVAVFSMVAPWLQTLVESQDAWILFVVAALVLYCLIEELRCQHPHSLCIFCLLDGLLSQKVYDPLYVVIEEFLYIPLCVIAEELYCEVAGGSWFRQGEKMSNVTDDETVVGYGDSQTKGYISDIWHMLRNFLFLIGIAYAIFLYLAPGAGQSSAVPENAVKVSPLENLLERGNVLATEVLDADAEIMMQIYKASTLQLRTMVIAETVVPYNNRHLLSNYVQQQLHASDVVSESQQRAVMAMVDMAPAEAAFSNEEIGEMGSLRNAAVLALFKRQGDNIHFMLIGVRAEPRLGWNWISKAQRNSWNDVLSRVLTNKIRKEAKNYVCRRDPTISDPPKLSRINLAMKSK